MALKIKVFKARIKLVSDYGLQAFISKKIKKIVGIAIIDVLIWVMVLTPFFSKSVFSISNPLLAEVQASSSEEKPSANNTASTSLGDKALVVSEARPQSPDDIKTLIRQEFGDQGDYAVKIAKCESQLDPSKIGDKQMDYWSYGLFQINRTWHKYPEKVLLDPVQNVKIAKQIYDKGGWNRWSCNRLVD